MAEYFNISLITVTTRHGENMILFLDTEFTDFTNPDLISFALVSETKVHVLYVEILDYVHENASDFVKQVVVPLLKPNQYGRKRYEAADNLARFLIDIGEPKIDIAVDFGTDWTLLIELLDEAHPELKEKLIGPNRTIELTGYQQGPFFIQVLLERGFNSSDVISKACQAKDDYEELWLNQSKELIHHALHDAESMRYGWVKAFEQIS